LGSAKKRGGGLEKTIASLIGRERGSTIDSKGFGPQKSSSPPTFSRQGVGDYAVMGERVGVNPRRGTTSYSLFLNL